MRIVKSISLSFFVVLLSSCVITYKSIIQDYAVLTTEKVRISAVNEDWELFYGKPVKPPRYHDSTRTVSEFDGHQIKGGGPAAKAITADYQFWMENPSYARNTIDVKVHLDSSETILNGKMLFISAREDMADTSAKRAWTVNIPQQYIDIAKSGQVAVVYQPAKVTSSDTDIATWILWFSALPL